MTNEQNLILILSTFLYLDGDVLRETSYGVYECQLIHLVRVSSKKDKKGVSKSQVSANPKHQGDIVTSIVVVQGVPQSQVTANLRHKGD